MKQKLPKLIIALAIPQLAGLIGSLFTTNSINNWFSTINKPSFNPPNWIFGPVWTILFILMGIALYLVWQTSKPNKKNAYKIFTLQLLFNILWSVIFFGLQSPQLAFLEIIALLLLIVINIFSFYRINKLSAYLLIPYLVWVSFASVLNFSLWQLNL